MTEDQAKAKWCPMARFVIDTPEYPSGNRFDSEVHNEFCKCIASDCAWWVEEKIHKDGDINNEMIVIGGHCGAVK